MADGSIEFDTRLDSTNVKSQLAELKKQFADMAQQMKGLSKDTERYQKILDKSPNNAAAKKGMEGTLKAIHELQEEMNATEAKIGSLTGIADLANEADKTTSKLNSLYDRYSKMVEMGKKPNSEAFKSLNYDIDQTEQKLSNLYDQMEKVQSGSATGLKASLSGAIAGQQQSRTSYAEGFGDQGKFSFKTAAIELAKKSFAGLGSAMKGIAGTAKNLITGAKNSLSQMLKQNVAAKRLSKSIFSLSNMFKMMGLRMLMRAAWNSLQTGFQNLIASSSEASKSMSALKSSATYFANSIASAFAPVLNAVSPILSKLIDMVSQATQAIGKLFALLGGKSTYTVAVKQNEKLSSSISGTGSAAKKAADEEKKALASFDEINQLNLKDDSEASSGGGGGSSGAGVFKDVPIAKNDWMKQLIDAGDWVGLGTAIADKVNESISKIKWSDIGKTIGKGIDSAVKVAYGFMKSIDTKSIGVGLGDMLNASMEVIDSDYIGRTIAQTLNRAVDLALGFVTTFDFSQFGVEVSQIINGFFEDVDVNSIYETIRGIFVGIWNFVYALFTNIDYATIMSKIGEFIGDIIAGIGEFISTMGDALAEYFVPFIEDATAQGGNVVDGFLLGIGNALLNIGKWIVDNIFTPFITGFKAAFQIGSPSKVMETQGGFIMEGMFNGLTSWMGAIKQFFLDLVEKVKGWFGDIITWVKESFTSDWDTAWENIKKIFTDVWNAIASVCETVVNGIVDALNRISFDTPDWLGDKFGGKHFGFSLSRVSIPRLATGTVIPPSAGEFAAILGDNNTDTEVVSPLETMKEAMLEALQESGSGQKQIVLKFDGNLSELARILKPELEQEDRRAGVQLVVEG